MLHVTRAAVARVVMTVAAVSMFAGAAAGLVSTLTGAELVEFAGGALSVGLVLGAGLVLAVVLEKVWK